MIYGSDLDSIFERVFGNNPNSYYKTSVITKGKEDENNYEVNQTKDGAYLFFEAPGFNKSNLKVEIELEKNRNKEVKENTDFFLCKKLVDALPSVLITMHMAWGFGFLTSPKNLIN